MNQVWKTDTLDDYGPESVAAHVRETYWIQVTNQVWNKCEALIWDQVWSQVGDQVWSQVYSQVGDQVWSQVYNQVTNQVRNQVPR